MYVLYDTCKENPKQVLSYKKYTKIIGLKQKNTEAEDIKCHSTNILYTVKNKVTGAVHLF